MCSQTERSLLMVKPDGIEKGLTPYIRKCISREGLTITKEKLFKMNKELAESLYEEYKHRNDFLELINFITSEPVMVFLVSGKEAVNKVRKIIGKRYPPSGIRAQYAESIIRNIAHGPDSIQSAQREIELIFGKELY